MTVTFRDTVFDEVAYDRDADVVYLRVDGAEAADWRSTPEGHFLAFDASGKLISMTIVAASKNADDKGVVLVTVPNRDQLALQDLGLAMA